MSERSSLCGNCKHFVAGGLCELVKGQIKAKDTCDLHAYGHPQPIDTEVDPKYNKLEVNYKPGFMVETVSTITTGDVAQKALQMEHELLLRGIPEEEVKRAVIAYFSEREPPFAQPWPGPVTGVDFAGNVNYSIVPDTGQPNTNFAGLPKDVQPYPTPNKSPYGIGSSSQPYQSFFSPDPNSVGSLSNVYDVLNPPYPYKSESESANWLGTANKINSEPSMHGEHGFNVAKAIPEWRYNIEDSQMYPLRIPDIIIPPSGTNPLAETDNSKQLQAGIEIELEHTTNRNLAKQIALDHLKEDPKYYTKLITHVEPQKKYLLEAKKEDKKKNKLRDLLLKWAILLGGAIGINKILDSLEPDKPLEIFAKYTAKLDDKTCPECRNADGKVFNLVELHIRPVLPSENLGYTTRHPNCRCQWNIEKNYTGTVDSLSRKEESDIHKVESHITDAAKDGTLHKVKKDGELSKKTTKKNPLKEICACQTIRLPPIQIPQMNLDLPKGRLTRKLLQESIAKLRSQFDWLTEDYVSKARELAYDSDGVLYLVRAAGETITDHRSEGEPYKRKLSADELNSMTRTAIGKSMDINHQPEFEVDATILDAEFDKYRKEIQMLVIVRDDTINDAIDNRKITAVSINGGMPRSETIEQCDHECTTEDCELCLVPKGVVLGELDGIGMTFVVTDPRGLYWDGHFVPSAEPGVKFTKIEVL